MYCLFFLFFFLINFNIYINQIEAGALQSTSQIVLKTSGRLILLKQKDLEDERESLAVAWAAELHSLLTQLKIQLRKNSLRMLLTVLLIVQSGAVGEEDKGSKQFLASPSMTMRGHFSTLASWIAQRMADASALRGEHVGVDLAHTFNTSPLWSLATTAIALLCLPMAASVLSLIQPRGGGFHLWREVTMLEGGGTLEDLTKEYSASLWWISLMDAWVSMTPPWCTNWFLTRQISSRTKDMFRVVIQLSSRGHGACGGSVSSFMISPLVEHEWSSGLKPHQQENHNALAIEHWRNRWTVDSISWWHRGHKSSRLAILRWRFSLVGSMFARFSILASWLFRGPWSSISFSSQHQSLWQGGVVLLQYEMLT